MLCYQATLLSCHSEYQQTPGIFTDRLEPTTPHKRVPANNPRPNPALKVAFKIFENVAAEAT